MRILFLGDMVGQGAREAVRRTVSDLRNELSVDFCIANGENMAGGNGFTRSCLRELADCGVDVFTSGDHVWDQKGFEQEIEDCPNVLRPANFAEEQPGRGHGLFPAANGAKVGVICLIGRTFMGVPSNCPFHAADRILAELAPQTPFLFVDFHAEATSDKIALAHYLDGRVSAVIGTHTHVPTADEQILPRGTAFQCDAGMCGSRDSILGREVAPILRRYLTGLPTRFTVMTQDIRLQGTLVTLDETGHAVDIQRIARDVS